MKQNGELEVDTYRYNQLSFDEGAKAIQWSKNIPFNQWY